MGESRMELGPEFSLEPTTKAEIPATRQFTDREKPRSSFLNALKQKQNLQYKVLTFYGVGGIGKTRLQKEFMQMLNHSNPDTIKAVLDFKEENLREPANALIWLSETLKKEYKIKFTSFDLAYTVYWSKLHPHLALKDNKGNLPFIEEGTFIAELLDQLQYIPLAQWVPNTMKFIRGISKYKDMLNWWVGSGKKVLEQVNDLMPSEIEKRLPLYWAQDLKNHINENTSSIVLFIDTYEALWEKNRNQGIFEEKDKWVRELVLQVPEALWIICGREKLRWEVVNEAWKPFLEQHLIGELSVTDSDKFLRSCKIDQADIRKVIIDSSKGLPYYLDLMVDTYNLIKEKRLPDISDFSKTPKEISNRFMQYLETSEKSTIKILSFPRYWDTKLFTSLVTHYKTGYEVFDYKDLFRFSFFNNREGKKDQWNMHTIMRDTLQQDIEKNTNELFINIHQYLFTYYNEKINKTSLDFLFQDDGEYFREAFYHACIAQDEQESLSWFLEIGDVLLRAGKFQLIKSFFNEVMLLIAKIKDEKIKYAAYQYFGKTFLLQGNYDEAIRCYNLALDGYKGLISKEANNPIYIRSIGICSMDLAEIMIHTAEYEKAYKYLFDSQAYYAEYTGQKDKEFYFNHVLQQIRLGKLNIRFSKYEESRANYDHAITLCDTAISKDSHNPSIYGLKALAYEKLGELLGSKNYQAQEECYLKSIEYYNIALSFKDEIDYIRTLANQGLAHKRLAEHYDRKTNAILKIKNYQQAIDIYNEVLKIAPDFVDALEKKGHALVDYMVLQINLGLYYEAIESFNMAKQTFSDVLSLSPKQEGSRNRLGSAYRELGKLYMEKGEPDKALAYLESSMQIYNEMIENKSEYIYVHNSMGKTYKSYGDCYLLLNNEVSAKEHYRLAINEFNNMLGRAPELRGAIRDIKEIEDKLLSI